MPYRKGTLRAGQYYHLYNRGNNRQPIFLERENCLYFLRQLRKYLVPAIIDVIAYCLMPNHYHFLVYLRTDNLSRPMQRFSLSYTKALNKRYERVGSLFQGRFKAVAVDSDEYVLHLSRYIHLNPVLAGLVARPEDWEFSSYHEYIGVRQGTLPSPGVVLSQFSSPSDYRQFILSYATGDDRVISDLTLE